jgi:pyruvate/2-oxoglutarate dehydrogenase complex dihydrolipoamide dehydrogenase (E3) component
VIVAEQYDAIVVGSGQAGGPLSTALVAAGRSTILVEREHIGGTCINVGCTPTKTMVASARTAYVCRRAADFGVRIGGDVAVDMKAVRARKRAIVDQFQTHSREQIEAGGVRILMGSARFTGREELAIATNEGGNLALTAPLIVLDAGARPAVPPIQGIDTVPILDSTSIMELDELPGHLLVVGGGYVGVEFAQMFRRFGSRVTIIQKGPALLAREDDDVAGALAEILREDGIDIILDADVTRVAGSTGAISLDITVGREEQRLSGTHLLAATGRVPNTKELDLHVAGVETDDRGFIRVDERLRTTNPAVYAVGDVKGGPAFTHISYDDFRILKRNLIEGGDRTTVDRLVPYVVFTDPQLGRVGMSEREAKSRKRAYRIARLPMSDVARAIEVGETRGMMKALVDAQTSEILGCAMLGMEGGELMAMMEIAILGRLPYTVLSDGIFAHPTLAEGINSLFGTLRDG